MPELYSGVLLFVDASNTPAFLLFPTHVFSTLHELSPPRPGRAQSPGFKESLGFGESYDISSFYSRTLEN